MALAMSAAQTPDGPERRRPSRSRRNKPTVLFVDDEQRVLNSMRALFRRDYEVFITTRGSEAVKLLGEKTIDVIVADQRMPEMTGVEVLGAAKEVSPVTVRILLTGYADLDAIEGSINVGEVFRFLSKPCPPNHLRETLKLAIDIAHTTRAEAAAAATSETAAPAARPDAAVALAAPPQATEPAAESADTADDPVTPSTDDTGELIVSGDELVTFSDTIATDAPAPLLTESQELMLANEDQGEEIVMAGDMVGSSNEIVLESEYDGGGTVAGGLNETVSSVGVVVFSSSESFAGSASDMLSQEHEVQWAKTLVQVTEILSEGRAGVLVTDFVSEGRVLRKMIATLKRYLPELITIVISDDRDASEMISLINHGQVFRYMSKPAQRDRFTQNVNAAVLKHIQLRDNPELLKRYQVEDDNSGGAVPQMFKQFLGRIKGMRRLLAR